MSPANDKRRLRITKFAASLKQGKTQKQAAIDAGYSPNGAEVVGSRMAKLPEVKHALADVYRELGVTEKHIVANVMRGLKEAKLGPDHLGYLDRLREDLGYGPKNEPASAPIMAGFLTVIQQGGLRDENGQPCSPDYWAAKAKPISGEAAP